MSHSAVYVFLGGALAATAAVAGLFFLRFWRVTKDRFFVFFAVAFWLLAVNWAALAAISPAQEARHLVFLVRLAAFLVLIFAIYDKNRSK
jgi:hypothetical protein